MRALGAVLGWVLVAAQPTKDYTARKNIPIRLVCDYMFRYLALLSTPNRRYS